MRTTGTYTVWRYEIQYDKPNEPIYLIPFGDVHKSSPMHSKEKWQDFLAWAKTKKRCYFLGMGDYQDLGSSSERTILGNPNLHESTYKTLEQLYLAQVKAFAKDIDFMKGRLIGLIEGNHYGVFSNGINTDQKLCELMGCKYLGVNSLIRLVLKPKSKHNIAMSVDIFAHHGRGGSRTSGASMNPVERMMDIADAQIYLMGDNHQKGIVPKSRIKLSGQHNLISKQYKVLLIRTGSFLESYEDGQQSYVVDMNLPPTDLGVVKIELTPRCKRIEGGKRDEYIDIHASI